MDFGYIFSPWPLFLLSRTKGFFQEGLRCFYSSVLQLDNALLLGFGVLECVLNIGRNPDLRKEESRGLSWLPIVRVHWGEACRKGGGGRGTVPDISRTRKGNW